VVLATGLVCELHHIYWGISQEGNSYDLH
jgi:hypothetical protein